MATFGGIVVTTGTEASGRRTFLDIIDEIARPVDAADTTVRALAADAFRAAVRVMNRKGLWPWEIQDEDVAITANQQFSTVTSPIKKPLAMHILTAAGGTRVRRMRYMPYDQFIERFTLDRNSEPHTYTFANLFETGQVRWFPTPAANLSARLTYYRITPAPRTEQEAVEIPDYAIEAYTSRAWYEFLKRRPSEQRSFPIATAFSEWRLAFREMAAHVNTPGDRSRQTNSIGNFGGY